jgi:hypothetical protein
MADERTEDPFELVDRMLDQQMLKHFEMANMIGEYRNMLADMQEQRSPDQDMVKLARSLPGARYHVASTYVRENWLVLEGELKRLFPLDESSSGVS